MRFVLTYGVGFITLMFLGFLSGYMFGFHIMGYDHKNSMIMSLVIGSATLFVEAFLMIFRIYRMDEQEEAMRKNDK